MRILIWLILSITSFYAAGDTINHYMGIVNNIPQMEMKADLQAQAWARSARNILLLTDESIAETLSQGNKLATAQSNPLFCLPTGTDLTAATLHDIILKTYNGLSSQQSDKDKLTVSEIAWLGVIQTYPCQTSSKSPLGFNNPLQAMQHSQGK